MRARAKVAAAAAALLLAAAIWLAWPAAGVPILTYHKVGDTEEAYSVAPAAFERQMGHLAAAGYTAVSLADLADYMAGGKTLPAKPVVITFDDGYADNFTAALPILEKHGMKATVFIITDFVGQEGYMTWEQVRALQARGMEIGSHTLAHRALTSLPPAERQRDVRASKEALEWRLGRPAAFLSYPFGEYDAAMFAILQQAGYRGACTTAPGLNKPGDNLYALKRINIHRSRLGMWEFRLRLLRANVYGKLGIEPGRR